MAAFSLAAIVVAFAILLVQRPPYVLATGFPPHAAFETSSPEPLYVSSIAFDAPAGFVHSASAVDIGGGRIRACWLSGTDEGKPDVAIHTSVFDPGARAWSPQRVMITREWVRDHLHRNIIALGNPIMMQHPDGRLLLWFVSVSIGGWSGSALNMTVSNDGGETWQPPTRLITTPFFNVSTLVRQPAFLFADGTIGLPAYHECIGIFAELLRLDPDGRVLHKQRMTSGRTMLQPKIVAHNEMEATAFLRRDGAAPRLIHTMHTADGGRTWSEPRALDLLNPGSPVAATRLASGRLNMVFNDSHRGRKRLTLGLSDDGGSTWRIVRSFDGDGSERAADDVSYPWMIALANGEFHLLYTADLKEIRHVHFNLAWLEQQR